MTDSATFDFDTAPVLAGPDAVAPRQSDRIVFGLDGAHFVGILARASLLELLTLGLYRFWLVNDIRRFLWSHTSLEGERLEYAGHGHELFAGFLWAFGLLLLMLGAIYVSASVLEFGATSAAVTVLFLFLRQVASFQARRYRLSRSVWRGVRFWMAGSLIGFAARAVLWDALSLLSLGLLWPWRVASLERYQLSRSGYGGVAGRFEGHGRVLFRRAVWMWALMAVPVGGAVYLAVSTAMMLEATTSPSSDVVIEALFGAPAHLLPLAMVLLSPFLALFLYALYKAEEWRWWLDGIRFGALEPHSILTRRAMVWLYVQAVMVFAFALVALAVLALVLGLVILVAAGIPLTDSASISKAFTSLDEGHPYAVLALLAGGYVVVVLTLGAISRFYYDYAVWRAVVPSLSFHHLEAVEDVAAEGKPSSAVGEGLLSLLKIGGL